MSTPPRYSSAGKSPWWKMRFSILARIISFSSRYSLPPPSYFWIVSLIKRFFFFSKRVCVSLSVRGCVRPSVTQDMKFWEIQFPGKILTKERQENFAVHHLKKSSWAVGIWMASEWCLSDVWVVKVFRLVPLFIRFQIRAAIFSDAWFLWCCMDCIFITDALAVGKCINYTSFYCISLRLLGNAASPPRNEGGRGRIERNIVKK